MQVLIASCQALLCRFLSASIAAWNLASCTRSGTQQDLLFTEEKRIAETSYIHYKYERAAFVLFRMYTSTPKTVDRVVALAKGRLTVFVLQTVWDTAKTWHLV